MISQEELKEEIRKKGGTVYKHDHPVGLVHEGRLHYGVGCVRIDAETACDIVSDGSASCWYNNLNYTVSPGIIVPAAEAPLATEEDERRTREFIHEFNPTFDRKRI